MMEWRSNDGMTFKWWNEIQMTWMASKWQNDIQMMEWYVNEVARSKWARNDGMTLEWWNEIQMTWMTIGWMKWHPNEKTTVYCQHNLIDWMTLKWRNDIQMMGWRLNDVLRLKWARNDEMTMKWWNIIQMTWMTIGGIEWSNKQAMSLSVSNK